MHRSSAVVAVLALTVLALSLPFSLALAASAFAQEPEPPSGEPQPGNPEEPEPPIMPEEPAPTPETPGGEQPGAETGGQLPHTGWDAALYLGLGVLLVLVGARLRVLTRIRQVVERVRRRSTQVALREALEPIRAARLTPPEPDPDVGPLHVEPSTATARRRMAGVAEHD
jgi:hypothetical protein